MKTIKFEIQIRALATELFEEKPCLEVDEWPLCGWTEGFRAFVTDVTNPEKPLRSALECGDGLSGESFTKLVEAICAQIQSHFIRIHMESVVSEVNGDELIQMRKQRANQH